MPRVKRGITHVKKRRKILKRTKGFNWGRKNKIKLARTAGKKAGAMAYKGRKRKKQAQRQLWQVQLNAAVREQGLSYSQFMNLLKKKKVGLDRKILAEIAQKDPAIFKKIIDAVK